MFTQVQFEQARSNLSAYLLNNAEIMEYLTGVEYEAADEAPNTYEALSQQWADCHTFAMPKFKVWNGCSETTVYTTQEANYAFRFWHDVLHCSLHLDFSLKSEIEIGKIQTRMVQEMFGNKSLEAMIMLADTVGQSLYSANNNGEFPENQLLYVFSLLQAQFS